MLAHGSVTFSGIWTTETKCQKEAFSQVRQINYCKYWTRIKVIED